VLTIGLTGGIGSGKSTVAQWFEKQHIPVLDADKTVHRLLQYDRTIISKLVHEFGPEILLENGQINRSQLGSQVFCNEDARKRLERIVHPRVVECMNNERAVLRERGVEVCVFDVPLLFEAGLEHLVDEIWVVWVPRDLQILRVLARDKLNLDEVESRISAQTSLDDKCKRAHVVIDNSGNELETALQLEEAWKKFLLKQRRSES